MYRCRALRSVSWRGPKKKVDTTSDPRNDEPNPRVRQAMMTKWQKYDHYLQQNNKKTKKQKQKQTERSAFSALLELVFAVCCYTIAAVRLATLFYLVSFSVVFV
jgi:hypothetical protein